MFSKHSSSSPVDGLAKAIQNITIETSEKPIPSWLRSAESPFNWQPRRPQGVSCTEVIDTATEKAEYDDLLFDKFIRLLTLVYEYSFLNQFEDANTMMMTAESLLDSEMEQNNNNESSKFMHAIRHVQNATHAHLLAAQGLENASKQESEKLVPVSRIAPAEQAAVQALKAKFFALYKKEGFQQTVECARKALQLSPDEPMWMFLLAESLRKNAKYYPNAQAEIPREELELLERAVQKDRNPRYLVHLAFRYTNCVKSAFHQHRHDPDFKRSRLFDTIDKMNDTAVKMYKEAVALAPDDEIVNRRCGFGLMKTDHKTTNANRELIKTTLEKALNLAPDSSMTLHYLGKYYRELEKNNQKAQEYFEQAVRCKITNFGAQCDLIKLKCELYGLNEYDPMEDLSQFLEQTDNNMRVQILSQMVAYQLLVKQNLGEALKYFQIISQQNMDFKFLTNLRPFFSNWTEVYDLCEILANEILKADKEDFPQKNEVVEKLNEISPMYFKNPVNYYLIETIMSHRGHNRLYAGSNNRSSNSQSQNKSWRSEQTGGENIKSWRTEKQPEKSESERNWRSQSGNNQNRNQNSREPQRRALPQERWPIDRSNWRKRTPSEVE